MSLDPNELERPRSLSDRRRQAARGLMRREILESAQHIIRSNGLDALSLRVLARSVGVTAPALYGYFDSKEAILRALFEEGAGVLLAQLDGVIANNPPGLQTLLVTLDGYRRFAQDEPDYFRLLFGTVDPILTWTEAELVSMGTIYERFQGIISSAMTRGELKTLPVTTVSCALWSLVHGVAVLENERFMATKRQDHEHASQFDAAVRLVLNGLATPLGARMLEAIEATDTRASGEGRFER